MLIHRESHLAIYFGTAEDKLYPDDYLAFKPYTPLLDLSPYNHLKTELHINSLYFLHQVHSTMGYRLEEHDIPPAYKKEGDYLITTTRNRGVGVMTADCLPIIIASNPSLHSANAPYSGRTGEQGSLNPVIPNSESISKDKKSNHEKSLSDHPEFARSASSEGQLTIIHAGWRGSVAGIVDRALLNMRTTVADLHIFFGPSARACCYEVAPSFADNLPASLRNQVLISRAGKLFFDLPLFNSLLMQKIGIKPEQINTRYNYCTLCDEQFFSHRRQGTAAGRQMTVATLL